jgi:hypothetical protein
VRLALALAAQINWGPGVNIDEKLDKIDKRVADLWEQARIEAEPPVLDSVARTARRTKATSTPLGRRTTRER